MSINFYHKRGFSLIEILIAISLSGILLVMLCTVFLYGLKAIEKGRYRATAVNICDRKITCARKMIKELDSLEIEGGKAYSILTNGDDTGSEVKIGGVNVPSGDTVKHEVFKSLTAIPVDIHGFVTIAGTATYEYKMHMEDYNLTKGNMKMVKVEINWKEEKTGSTSLSIQSLISQDFE